MDFKRLLSLTRSACQDYNMIADGDRIAVGVSGGKDSLALLAALRAMRDFYPVRYGLEAVTVALGFRGEDFSEIGRFCQDIGVNYTVVESDIGQIVFEERHEQNPCSLCAKLRKGALNTRIRQLACNKVAYGHNRDDVIETFFMSLFYGGRIHTFAPVTYLSRMDISVIRPLIYAPEREIAALARKQAFPVQKSLCPVDGLTKRAEIADFIEEYARKHRDFEEKIFGAIKRSRVDGWGILDGGGLQRGTQ